MGEPAALSAKDRVDSYNLAHDMVAAIENDEGSALAVMFDCDPENLEGTALRLAQLVLHQDREIELLRSIAAAALAHHQAVTAGVDDTESWHVLDAAIEHAVPELKEMNT